MKVLFDYQIFSLQKFGGISRYFSELCRRLNELEGIRADIFCALYINDHISRPHGPRVKGIPVPNVKSTGRLRGLINRNVDRIHGFLTDYDIVHKTYYQDDRLRRGTHTVVTVYDMIHERFPGYYPSRDKTSQYKRKCCERADQIIAISNATKEDLIKFFGLPADKIAVIHLASSLHGEGGDCGEAPRISGPYLLFVGERRGYKNFLSFVRAFAQSPSLRARYHVLCFGGGPFSEEEANEIASLGIRDRVHQTSGGDASLAACYRHAAAYVCPSLYEGFGIPLLEAMGLSCPVICADAGSIPEVTGDAGVYFNPADLESMQAVMEDTLLDSNKLKRLKDAGLQRERLFSWERCTMETIALYDSVLNGKRGQFE